MALDQLLRENARMAFQIVNVLGEIGQELAFVLEQLDECMSRRELAGGREDVLCDGVKDARVFPEDTDVEDFLWVAEPKVLQLRV